MRYLSLAVIFAAMPAYGQDMPVEWPADEWSLDQINEDHYQVTFYNSEPPSSAVFPRSLSMENMEVDLNLEWTSGPEILYVYPPVGWIADPPFIVVDDGSIGFIDIIRDEEWQGM